jgi:hypothetical protein
MASALEAPPSGCSAADEVEHWKKLAQENADELHTLQEDFLEFQEASQMTEEEVLVKRPT